MTTKTRLSRLLPFLLSFLVAAAFGLASGLALAQPARGDARSNMPLAIERQDQAVGVTRLIDDDGATAGGALYSPFASLSDASVAKAAATELPARASAREEEEGDFSAGGFAMLLALGAFIWLMRIALVV